MTPLQRAALASLPLTEATVESFYDGTRSGTAEQCLRALCVSHERLRAELQGAEALLADGERDQARLTLVLALTDTGSDVFREAFPVAPVCWSDHERANVAGWRVVDKIRQVLLGGDA